MAAAFVPSGAGTLRQRLRDDFGPRFHWSEITDPAIRHKFLAKVVEHHVDVRAVVLRKVLGAASEAGRARCLGALLSDLAKAGGNKLTIDKRETGEKNALDTAQITSLIKREILPADFEHSFEKPPAEPIIWIADAVAGAVQAQFTSKDSQYIEAIQALLRLRELP